MSQITASPIRDFKDLQVWQVARELRTELYRLAKLLPDFEKFGLASQIRRAASSVTANIAEGFGRFGYQENAQMCRQARGSLYELRDHLTTCIDRGLYYFRRGGKTRCSRGAGWPASQRLPSLDTQHEEASR